MKPISFIIASLLALASGAVANPKRAPRKMGAKKAIARRPMKRAASSKGGSDDGLVILRSGSADLSAGTIDIPASDTNGTRAAVRAPMRSFKAPRPATDAAIVTGKEAGVDEWHPSYLDQPLNRQAAYLKAQDELRGMIDDCEAMCRAMQKPDSVPSWKSERWMLQLNEMEDRMVYRANSFWGVYEGKPYRGMAGIASTTLALARTRRFVCALAEPHNPRYSFNITGDYTFAESLKYWIEHDLPALRARIQ